MHDRTPVCLRRNLAPPLHRAGSDDASDGVGWEGSPDMQFLALALVCSSVRRYCGAAEADGTVLGAPGVASKVARGRGGRGAGAAGASPTPAGPISRVAGGDAAGDDDDGDEGVALVSTAAHLDRCRDEVSSHMATHLPDLLLKFGGTAVGTHMTCTQLLAPLSMTVFGMGHLTKRFDDLLHQLSRLVLLHTDAAPLQALAVALRCAASVDHAKVRDAVLKVQATTRTLCGRVVRLAAAVTGDVALAAASTTATSGAKTRPSAAKGKRASAAAEDEDDDGMGAGDVVAGGGVGGAGQASALLFAFRRLGAVVTALGSLATANVEALALPASGSAASLTVEGTPVVYAAVTVLKHARRLNALFAAGTWQSSGADGDEEEDDADALAAARSPTFHPGLIPEAMTVLCALASTALHAAATAIVDEAATLEDGSGLSSGATATLQHALAMRELTLGQAQALMQLAHPAAATPAAAARAGRTPAGGDHSGERLPRLHSGHACPPFSRPPPFFWRRGHHRRGGLRPHTGRHTAAPPILHLAGSFGGIHGCLLHRRAAGRSRQCRLAIDGRGGGGVCVTQPSARHGNVPHRRTGCRRPRGGVHGGRCAR